MFLFVILAAQLMVVLDTTIVNVALPHIQEGLGLSGGEVSWVINGYLLTFGGLLLLGARSGDLLGRRRTFLAGIAIFTLSSLLGGLAVTGWMLLAARALQGIGAALAAPSSLALLTTVFSEGAQRVRAIGLFTTVSAAGGAIGHWLHAQESDGFLHAVAQTPPRDSMQLSRKGEGFARRHPSVQAGVIEQAPDAPLQRKRIGAGR